MDEQRWQAAVDAFPVAARPLLQRTRERGGVVGADDAAMLSRATGDDVPMLAVALLPVAAAFATVPLSGFAVGAVAVSRPAGEQTPALYLGANLEIAGLSLGPTLHAEQSAVLNAWLAGAAGIDLLAASAAPCGYCRQFLMELGPPARLAVRVAEPGADPRPAARLDTLLPQAFGPQALGISATLLDAQPQRLALPGSAPFLDALVRQALEAAQASYAPYTGNLAGCAMQTAGGRIVSGRCAESAAYNPTVSPMQAALSALNLAGETGRIVRAVLVERGTPISYRAETEALLAKLAPQAAFDHYTAG